MSALLRTVISVSPVQALTMKLCGVSIFFL